MREGARILPVILMAGNVLTDRADAFSNARRDALSDMVTMNSSDDGEGFQFMASVFYENAMEKAGTGEIFTLNSLTGASGFREHMFDTIRTIGNADEEFMSSLIKDIPSFRNRLIFFRT